MEIQERRKENLLEEEIKQERIGGEKIERKEKRKIKSIRKNIEGKKIRLDISVDFLCILII